jgi:hypothetical protein
MQQQAAALQYQVKKNINLFVGMIENRWFMHHHLDAFALLLSAIFIDIISII